MNIQEAKAKDPWLASLSDADAVGAIQRGFYPDLSVEEVGSALGVDMSKAVQQAPAAAPSAPAERTLGGTLKDAGITALKGAIAVPEAAVGLANLVTGGRAGKAVENMGVRFADAKKVLDEAYSEPQKQAFQNVANAEGFGGKLAAALDNSSVIAHTIGESLPGMVGGGLAGRALLKAAPKIGVVGAAAAGEGVYSAGQAAEQIRQETEDGLLTGKQSALSAVSGAATGILNLAGGKVAQRLGVNDLDTAIVRASKHPGIAKNLVRRVLEGAAAEGVLEELPQSISEQVLQNIALGKPMDEGVDHAAALGLLSGAAMGGAVNVPRGGAPAVAPAPAPAPENAPGVPGWTPPADVPAATLDEAALERAGVTPAARLDADRIEQMTGIGQLAPETRSLDERQIDALAPGDVQRGFDARVPGSMPPMALAQQAPTDGVDFKPGPLSRAASRAVPSVPDGGLALAPLEAPVAADPLAESAANAQALDDTGWPVDLETGAPMFNEATASPEDMAVYQQFMSLEADPLDAAIPDIFSSDLAATAVSDEEFLRAMGATDEEIANAINTRPNPDVRQDAADPAPAADPAASSPGGVEGQGGQATRAATGAGEPAGAVAAEPGGQPAAVAELAEHDAVSDDAFAGAHVPDDMDADIEAANRMLADASLAQASQIPVKQEARASAGDAATNGGAGQAMAQPAEPEEVRAPSGGPFKAKLPAINAAKRKGEGWEPVQVEGGWVARKRASGQGGLEGKDLGDGWVEFSPGSGSLRIPRAEMPQIKAEHRGAMVNFMNARGVQHQEDSVPAASLKPTQAEFSRDKVAKAKGFEGGNRSILVSGDGHVLDGHHQWLAARDQGEDVKVIRLGAPIRDLVKLAHEFPSSTASAGGATQAAPAPASTRRARSTPAGQTPADRWFELNASEREKLTQGAGLKGIIATRMAERRWANLPDAVREKIAAQLATAPAASSAGQPAPAESAEEKQAQPATADAAPTEPTQATALDAHAAVMGRVREGKASADEFKASFEAVVAGAEAIKETLTSKTKAELLSLGGPLVRMRYANEKKASVVDAVYQEILSEYALGESFTYGLAKDSYQNAIRRMVESADADKLAKFAQDRRDAIAEAKARREANAAALQDPQTLADFRAVLRHHIAGGDTLQEAYLRLTPPQRARYDELDAQSTREHRDAAKAKAKTQVASAGQTTAGEIIETKHTKHGHDLFVVQLAERVAREDYDTLNGSAKRLGGSYSSYRGAGAVPGFQFRTRESAEAFRKLVAGDTADAQAVAAARRDAFEDDRSQSAVERLRAMADTLNERASESLGRERKANTDRRARMAASAEAAARADQALAGTMRNLAAAIEGGKAKFLDAVRQKAQVEMLARELRQAKDAQIRVKYPAYADQERHRGEPVDAETVDFATFPSYTAMRSDLASLGRQMLEVDGTKKLGARLMSVADDVSEAYTTWAKENLHRVSGFGRGNALADFANKEAAERAIRNSGLTGKAIVLPIKRGQNRVVLSPSEAMKLGLWDGDGDKRITLSREFGQELVKAVQAAGGRKAGDRLALPWALENAHEKRNRLEAMGILTAAEYRSALREFAGLQEAMATPDKIKEMERAMVGRRADGLDFFPTSEAVVESMLDAATIEPGMAVLEPSAGMGHIADAIREKSGVEPDVVELSGPRRELLEAKGYQLVGDDFLALQPRDGFTYGDVFRRRDGALGVMRGSGGLGSNRVGFQPLDADGQPDARTASWEDREDLEGVERRGTDSGYDRIVMNPPFSKGRDIEHVRHAFELLRPGGRLVAIMGEGAFFHSNKAAEDFRAWLDELGATSEKLPDGSFMDPALPVNTGVSARMVVIDKPQASEAGRPSVAFSRATGANSATRERVQTEVDALGSQWANAPEIVVVADMRDPKVPEQVKKADAAQRSQGAEGDPEGFFYDGKVYLVASALPDAAATTRVLFHETLGHYGLRGVFGQELAGILHRFAVHRKADVIAKARQYGLVGEGVDVATATDAEVWASMSKDQRQYAAEEVLAQVAQDHPTQGFVRQAIAAIRTWLRAHVPGFADMRLSDGEVIRSFIVPARRFVESGQGRHVVGAPAFSLSVDQLAQAKAKWAATVDAFIRGGLDETKTHEVLPSSTEVMKAVGLPDLPIRAGVHALDALYNHGVKPSQMKQVLDELANPPLVMIWNRGRGGESSLNFVTSMSNPQGEPFVIALKPNKGSVEGLHHWMATVTEKQPSSILSMVRDGGAIYVGGGEIAGVGAQPLREALRFAKEKRGKEARELKAVMASSHKLPNLVERVLYAKDVASGGTDVQFSRAATAAQTPGLNNPADWRATANNLAADLFKTPGKVSWWHKTVGTMGDLARTSPKFKRTYDAVQRFISDVSLHANQAADAAPSILPKLDTWKDIGKTALSAEDTKALAAPVFEGTLTWARDETGKLVKAADRDTAFAQWDAQRKAQEMLRRRLVTEGELKRWQALPVASFEGAVRNRFEATMQRDGVVFTDAELRQHFKLDDRQIGLYRQFRAATDKSLAGMAISEMLRQGGEHTRLLAKEVMAESGPNVAQDARVQNAAQVLFEHLMNKADGLEGAQRAEVLELANSMQATAEKTTRLMEQGYAPLSRFGDYTVDVVGADGQRLYFGMFESRFDAGRMRRKMVQSYPDATVKQGTASKEAHKLFAGITPEALEIFGAMAGQDTENPVFQEYLRLAKDSRSATKRLIQRKGIAGFSEDVSRVLAGFIYSNSRLTATNLNTREIDQSLADFTNQEGELRDSAQKMADFVRNPQEAGQGIRAFMFAQYLGGSLASAIVNTTQPFAVTMPYLSQWAGVAGAGRHMAAAVKDAIKRRTGDAELDKALKRAEDEGVVSPQEVHQIMGMAMGKGGLKTGDGTALGNLAASASNLQQKVSVLWGQPFAIAEQFNRRSSFIAAYRIAQEQGMADPFKFAEQTVNDTQFVYNKGAKPEWARGAVGATLFTFKQYSVSYMELLYRMASSGTPEGRKAAMFALAMGLVISGVGGVPFMGDAEDIIDGILQRLGYSFSTKAARKQWLEGVFGKAGAEIIDSGFSGLPGMPLDVSGRLGMDNLIPGTGLLVTKADHTRDVGEVAGPAGDFVTRVFQGADMVSRGDVGKGVLQVMPNAVRNLAKGIQTGVEGEYTDTKGRKVIDAGWAEGITKAVGFQPRNVAQVQEATSLQSNLIAQNKAMRSRLVEEMTRAMYDRDAEAQAKVREKMRAWNRKNPDSPVAINMVSVRTKLKNMRMSKAERVAKTAPKDIRSEVRRQLADAGEAQ